MEELAPELFGAAAVRREPARAAEKAVSAVSAASDAIRERTRVSSPHILDPQTLPAYVDSLYRAAWALCGSREDAEDLVQDTFARVLTRPRVIRGEELWYLMRVLRNTFLNSRRDSARRPIVAAPLEDCVVVDLSSRSRAEHALEAQELYAAIATLPEDFRLALVAVDMLGLSYGEAARALGVREATITTRLFRARRAVVKELEGRSRTSSGAGTLDGVAASAGGARG